MKVKFISTSSLAYPLIICTCLCQYAFAQVIYVDASAPPAGNGTGWSTAYNFLQDALIAAQAGDDIWVAEGIYTPDSNSLDSDGTGDRYATFQLLNNVSIYGGFPTGDGIWEERDFKTYESVLSGDLARNDRPNFLYDNENSYHVVVGNGTNSTAIIDGFSITGGNASNDGVLLDTRYGGGIYIENGSPIIRNCLIRKNRTELDGGGLFCYNSSYPVLLNCIFQGNYARQSGGGMQDRDGAGSILVNCVFTGNVVKRNNGGGLSCSNYTNSILINCVFSSNSILMGGRGGGVSISTLSNPIISNCIIWGNSATQGPEIYTQESTSHPSVPIISYTCIQGGHAGTSNIDEDPKFAREPSDGGDGWGFGQNDDYGDLRLQTGSPCINVGDNNSIPVDTYDLDNDDDISELIPIDLIGNPRFINGRVDMGAYEGETPFDTEFPAVPLNVVVEDVTSVTATISWGPSTDDIGIAGYRIYRDGISVGISTTTSYIDSGLEPLTVYSYTVTAYDSVSNESAQSGPVLTATTERFIFYVDAGASTGGDGANWASAYRYLQDALAMARAGDQIRVTEGIYKPDQGVGVSAGDRAATFRLINVVAMYGGFPIGGGTWEQRNPNTYETLLSGDLNSDDGVFFINKQDNSYHVVTSVMTNPSTILDGFVITHGHGNDLVGSGGGMYNLNGSPTLVNCTYTANWASGSGGGFYTENGSPILVNCSFNGNSGGGWRGGAGMYNEIGNPTLTNCVFVANSSVRNGGGLSNNSSDGLALINCTFSNNLAEDYGGGIYNINSNSTLVSCIFWNNSATDGAQIALWNSELTVSYSDILGGEGAVYIGGECVLTWDATNIDADTNFIREPSDGGDDWGIGQNDDYGDLRFHSGSPCIDAADNNSLPADIIDLDGDGNTTEILPFDRDSDPRFVDDPAIPDIGNGTSPIADMGAYEGPVPPDTGPPSIPTNPIANDVGSSTVTLSWDASLDDVGVAGYMIYRDDVFIGISTSTNYTDSDLSPLTAYTYTIVAYDSVSNESLHSVSVQTTTTETIRVYVDASASSGGDGATWLTAFQYLQDALEIVETGDEVWIAEGIYKPDHGSMAIPGDRVATFQLVNGVALYGGFPASGGVWEDRDPNIHETILSGDLNEDDSSDFVNYNDNSYHVVTSTSCYLNSTILDGFTITGGNANNALYGKYGGGVLNQYFSSPSISN